MSLTTTAHYVLDRAKRTPNEPAHWVKSDGQWLSSSWAEYGAQVERAARALLDLGIAAGDTVCILGFNRPAWVIFDVAAMAVGAAPAGIYTTCSAVEVQYIIAHAEARAILVENKAQFDKVAEHLNKLPQLEVIVGFPGADLDAGSGDHPFRDGGGPKVLSWEGFLARADARPKAELDERMATIDPDSLATLIYTSGTTGPPKGVMLSHNNLVWTSNCLGNLTELDGSDFGVSYLPLSHIAEQTTTIHGPAISGGSVYFAESIEKVADNIREVQPTIMFGVPRIWEKYYSKVSERIGSATGLKKALVDFTRSTCTALHAAKLSGKTPSLVTRLKYKLADRLVLSKLKPALGLGNAKLCASGAAPIAKEILEFFASLDVVILEVYGQSEDTGPTSFNLPNAAKFGTVGRALPGVDVKIAEDGEILVKGPNVFLGYLKDQKTTEEVLIDGWLHSGDLGEIDSDGYLHITGRKKDIIITAGGKNIAPKNIEAALKNLRLINEAVVIGDRRKYLTALVTLDADVLSEAKLGTLAEAPDNVAIRDEIQLGLDAINADLARVETIKKFTILDRNLTVDRGELTPTLKVKRAKVSEHFADVIDAMY